MHYKFFFHTFVLDNLSEIPFLTFPQVSVQILLVQDAIREEWRNTKNSRPSVSCSIYFVEKSVAKKLRHFIECLSMK